MRVAVLASHEGTTLQALIDACADPNFPARVVMVISNNSQAGAMKRAAKANIPILHISSKTHGEEATADQAICEAASGADADLILLLGYMKRLGPVTQQIFEGRIINTHPSLLPKYGGRGYFGRRVHEAVLAAGEFQSGATLHYVEPEYDTGPVLAQIQVPVQKDDTAEALEQRVKAAEQQLLVATLRKLAEEAAS